MNEYWFRSRFQLRIHQSAGEAFQDFFSDLMNAVYGDRFQAVRPWGNLGDRGNDGFIADEAHYFQLHAPHADSRPDPVGAAGKARDDFAKLLQAYPQLKHYTFVHNDRYRGMPVQVTDALQDIASRFGVAADGLDSRKLGNLFNRLSDDDRMAVLGATPVAVPQWIDPRDIATLLEYLANRPMQGASLLDSGIAPEFNEKIKFNRLCPAFGDLLRSASYETGEVDSFLERELGLAQHIAEEIREIYAKSKEEIPDTGEAAPDVRFLYVQRALLPPSGRVNRGLEQAALVIMAKYFEACDIYESPV